jgi:hypothetical protein
MHELNPDLKAACDSGTNNAVLAAVPSEAEAVRNAEENDKFATWRLCLFISWAYALEPPQMSPAVSHCWCCC